MARDFVKLKREFKQLSAMVLASGVSAGASTGRPANGATTRIAPGPRTEIITLKDFTIPLVDEAGVVAFGSKKFFDLPEGIIEIEGASCNLVITKSSAGVIATFDGDFGIGTVAANNNAALATTEQNIIPTTPTPQAVAGVSSAKGQQGATVVQLDGTVTAPDLYLNVLVDDADHDVTATPCNLIFNGTIKLTYQNVGDY